MKKTVLICLLFVLSNSSFSQPIKRISTNGFAIKLVDSTLAQQLNIDKIEGMYINFIAPGSTSEKSGLLIGDILLKVDNVVTNSYEIFRSDEMKHYDGDAIAYTIKRDNKIMHLNGTAIGKPFEQSADYKTEYSSFEFEDGHIRSIFTIPHNSGKKPAILFIPGYPCQSIDNMNDFNSYKKLVDGLTKKGFIVMRAEKPGLGDSNNSRDCSEIDFPTEVSSFRAALTQLLEHPEVDKDNVFIFGHSLGGIEAPFVAKDMNVKGIIAMGITLKFWREYIFEAARIQNPNLGVDYVDNEKDMRLLEVLLYELFVNNKRPSDIIKTNPEYERLLREQYNYSGGDDFITRDISFSQTLHQSNLVASWANTKCKVLSAWGESDIQVLNDYSHRELVKIVNKYHPGNAAFLYLENTDHSFLSIPTIEESYQMNMDGSINQLYGNGFNNDVINLFDKWMKEVINSTL